MATWPAKTNYATGDVLTAAQMNDIGGELNDLYTTAGKAAGKNKIINGDFGIWQRGTSFTTNGGTYCADRWRIGGSGTAPTVSRETFTLGAAPVAGYESPYFLRWNQSSAATDVQTFANRIEDVRTFAGQSVVLSFWARINSGTAAPAIYLQQVFGTGGSPSTAVTTTVAASQTFTSSWVRYSFAVSVPSISGKTIGTNNDSYLQMYFQFPTSGTWQIDLWGVQLEAGSVATAFQTATGTIQGELAACQRYYQRRYGKGNGTPFGAGQCYSTTAGIVSLPFPVTLRATPSFASSGLYVTNSTFGSAGGTIAIYSQTSSDTYAAIATSASGLVAGNATLLVGTDANSYLELSAEL